jgi:hypothetical protein
MTPDFITKKLKLVPHLNWTAGRPRKAPNGNLLRGRSKETVWGYHRYTERKRAFFEDVVALIDVLEPHANFLQEIVDSGGRMFIALDLVGDTNIGDALSYQQLARLSALRIDLSVEVFPRMKSYDS